MAARPPTSSCSSTRRSSGRSIRSTWTCSSAATTPTPTLSLRGRAGRGCATRRRSTVMAGYDIVIRNGQVADGTGKKLFAADVALKGDRIAAVEEPGTLRGDNEIDAKGKVVAPGFIDAHTHDDTYLIDHPDMAMK